jgi:diaminopimelate epimerase
MSSSPPLRFSKMQGAGNDFVILDRRDAAEPLSAAVASAIADRHFGVGCDQLITIEPARSGDAIAAYGIWNADGSAARQCGNGARCVAAWLRRDGSAASTRFQLDSPAGPVEAECGDDGTIAIDMGVPDFTPAAIGVRGGESERDPYRLEFADGPIYFGAVSMGNPHAVIEVNELDDADVARAAARMQAHPFFTGGCNVGFARIESPARLKLRVVERGVGETLACGSGACAAVAVLARRGRLEHEVDVELPGGVLHVRWPGPGQSLWMSGPARFVFEGEFAASFATWARVQEQHR